MSPWRTTAENWEAAERELSRPKIARWTKSIFDWFGFSEKKGWDWLEFLARVSLPVVIAIGGWYWAGENSKQQQQINQAVQKDLVVSEYIKNIQQLVLEKNLSTAEPAEPVSAIARSLTLTALTRLREADSEQLSVHKGQILQFLHETGLITQRSNKRHVLVSNANLLLNGADLSGANLTGGDLSGANLIGANLNGADLARAYLRGTYFYAGYLRGASLSGAYLFGANLTGANLTGANLRGASLHGAKLSGTNLFKADLSGASLYGADLRMADLRMANLKDIKWNEKTKWPDYSQFAGSQNIPEALRKQLSF